DDHTGLFQQTAGEPPRVSSAGDRCPHEEGGPGDVDLPAAATQSLDHDVTALLVRLPVALRRILRPLQGGDPGVLDRLEHAGVDVRLDLAEPADGRRVPDAEPE